MPDGYMPLYRRTHPSSENCEGARSRSFASLSLTHTPVYARARVRVRVFQYTDGETPKTRISNS